MKGQLPPRSESVTGFAPVANSAARILILGSMPGARSLAAGEYYAHPRNDFWRIMRIAAGVDADGSYQQRLAAMQRAGIALWDVLHSCTRTGSLDAAIRTDSIIANDFRTFLRRHPAITRICFNGRAAQACFDRHVLPGLDSRLISYSYLPSTSPANASIPFAKKAAAWRAALAP